MSRRRGLRGGGVRVGTGRGTACVAKAGRALEAAAGRICTHDTTPVWPGSSVHERLMFPRALKVPPAVRVAMWMTTAPATAVPRPVWLSRTEGMGPDAGTVSGPEPVETSVGGTVSFTFSSMSPCGAMISALTSAVPSIHLMP